MTVSTLLKNKDKNVLTILQSQTLQDVSNLLTEMHIGALIVCSKSGDVEGIISERDVVRALANAGHDVLAQKVSQHMTSNPVTCSPFSTINHIMSKMTKGRFRHMPVIENGKLVAVISIGDIVKARIEAMESEAQAMQDCIGS